MGSPVLEKTMFPQHKQIIGSCDSPQSKATHEDGKIKWNLYALYQTVPPETLICPAKRKGVGYAYVVETLAEFCRLGHCPTPVGLSWYDEGKSKTVTSF